MFLNEFYFHCLFFPIKIRVSGKKITKLRKKVTRYERITHKKPTTWQKYLRNNKAFRERFAMAADIDAIKNSLKISLLLSLSNVGVTFSGQVWKIGKTGLPSINTFCFFFLNCRGSKQQQKKTRYEKIKQSRDLEK